MILFLFIFWLITPVFSADDEDPEMEAVLAASQETFRQEAEARRNGVISPSLEDRQLAEAIEKSMNPAHDAKRSEVGADSDEEELQRALELSLQKDKPKKTIEALVTKAQGSKTKTDYLKGLDSRNYIENLIGYMIFLKAHLTTGFKDLVFDVKKTAWDNLYKDLGLEKRAASNVFILLDKAKTLISKESINDPLLVDSMNHVMLELLAGKWGFSRKKLTADIKVKLKSAAVGIGRTIGNKGIDASQCAASIFRHFNNGPLIKTVSDPLLRKHRLAAFAYIANGYREGLIPERKGLYTSQLAVAVQSNFTPEDLKGFSLEVLIQEPRETLEKIAKVSTTSFAQQAAFDRFVEPLKTGDLTKLKAFLDNFDPGNIYEILGDEGQLNSLKLFQRALQDKKPIEIEGIINGLIENDLLPAKIRDIQGLLVETAHYSAPSSIDQIYHSSMQVLRLAGRGAAEPREKANSEDLDAGLQLWILEYFKAIYENGYYLRDAYIVNYPGVVDGKEVSSGTEIREAQAVVISEHRAVYELANQLKETAFPGVPVGQKTIIRLTVTGAVIDLVDEMNGNILETRNVNNVYAAQIATIRQKVDEYRIDPNLLPASAEKKLIPTDRPKNPDYAVRGGERISEAQKIHSRGMAIDVLIKQGRISRSLKLPILLYLDNW